MAAKSPPTLLVGLLLATGLIPAEANSQPSNSYKEGTSSPTQAAPIAIPARQIGQSTGLQQQSSLPEQSPEPPRELKLRANRQRYDARQERFIAEGNVKAVLNGGVLHADRIEFDSNFNTLYARGSVNFRKGSQYFQASSLRYSLIQKEGELEDVYGVLDLDSAAIDLGPTSPDAAQIPQNPSTPRRLLAIQESESLGFPTALDIELNSTTAGAISNQTASTTIWNQTLAQNNQWVQPDQPPQSSETSRQDENNQPGMACPPVLPPIPDWHPHPWAVTAWGGQMIDSNFGDTFLFNGRMREEYLLGLGLQKRIARAGPFALELEADLFAHNANQQAGGEFNQSVPFSDTPAQSFGEGVLGIGARLWVQPWLSFGVIEGISFNTTYSNYEKTYRENYAKLLNYLSFELEAAVSQQLSLVGRIHHRSGAFGTYSGVKEGSNAYLVGLRYRWGKDNTAPQQVDVPPPLGCPDPDRANRTTRQGLQETLESITLGEGDPKAQAEALPLGTTPPQAVATRQRLAQTNSSTLSPAEQEALRAKAIAKIDQRISSIQFQQALTIERRQGVGPTTGNIAEKNKYGGVRASQLKQQGASKLITGSISRWRIQAAKVTISPEGWKADRMGFSNDPYTPSQTRIDAEDVIATEEPSGDIVIQSRRNRLIVEERFPIPVSRTQTIKKQEEVENRWVFGIDNEDRDGFFVGRDLKPIELTKNYTLSLQPQFLLERAIDGETKSYVAPGSSIDSSKTTQPITAADLFGLEAELTGKTWGWDVDINADISTFNPLNIANGSRYWGDLKRDFDIPWIGSLQANLFAAYRYEAWNGSLGETDIYSAYGAFLQKKGDWAWGKLTNNYLLRAGAGNYQAEEFKSENLSDLWRANFYGSLNSSYPLWIGKSAALTPEAAYRYSPVAIVPGLRFNTNLKTTFDAYGDGERKATIGLTGGPALTLGTFSKPFLDFTRLSISGGGTLKQGSSPFKFDQNIDLATLGIGLTQQIAGPLLLNTGVAYNVDPNSPYYGDIINSNIELRWQRRSYDFGFYFNPYKGIGGFRFRLNDFNFTGTGVPFVPYTPINQFDQFEEHLF
ncbi:MULTISPECIES: DUF3769 domain-containing protein [unclassified Prochlorococcus]|uniref:DUF3769 domain-containing protein n=1 Tax=unclassified Prochlorococcus TaxID=2627481 RepID=UPI000533B1A3|nr:MULTISPECIES: DUF3769 domain-containing protein [unclassified Prochlorococcus]KGG26565.1 Repeats containing protein [Prochlorococcus sp. MIT 0701]KGG30120.1 Repeats containing protein [Prochlorococcus sp. MIT 0702]KGG33224.1 Repeats containing protein [Prochlorococcus sp. MIT 0703]